MLTDFLVRRFTLKSRGNGRVDVETGFEEN